MGAVSSCCGVDAAENKETIDAGDAQGDANKRDGASKKVPDAPSDHTKSVSKPTISDAELEAFQRRLEASMDVIVLLADGTRLTCQLKLNSEDRSIVISCDTNLRVIPLSDLKSVLHGKDQLKRVETKANLVDDPNCVALHMMTGNCIPMRFDTLEDKQAYVELIKKLKK